MGNHLLGGKVEKFVFTRYPKRFRRHPKQSINSPVMINWFGSKCNLIDCSRYEYLLTNDYRDGSDVGGHRLKVVQRRGVGAEDDVEDGKEAAQDDGQSAASGTEHDVFFAARIAVVVRS